MPKKCYDYRRTDMGKSFDFGKNWQSFINKYLNEDRINEAKKSLCKFLEVNDLKGKTFLDITVQ